MLKEAGLPNTVTFLSFDDGQGELRHGGDAEDSKVWHESSVLSLTIDLLGGIPTLEELAARCLSD